MITLFHTFHKALKTDTKAVSKAIKACYLLADIVPIMGDAENFIRYLNDLSIISVDIKIKTMLSEAEKIDNTEIIELINRYLKSKKEIAKMKYRSPIVVKTTFRMDLSMKLLHDDWVESKKKMINKLGFLELFDLCDHLTLGFYQWKNEDKVHRNKRKQWIDAENLFKLQYPDMDNKETLLVLTDIFYVKTVLNNHQIVSPLDSLANELCNSYLYPLTVLPNLHILSGTELISIRTTFINTHDSFRKKIDEWLLLCNTSEDKTAGLQYFIHNIIPEVPTFKQLTESHPILEYCNKVEEDRIYLFIGEITKSILLNYYKEYECITEETYQHLIALFTQSNELDRRIPVLFISKNASLQITELISAETDVDENNIELISGIRKFIRVD